jgi:glycosyltransferase involved in cell wall biosynthesis
MDNAPISVIITTYNDAEYLSNAIESVFNQKLLPNQLVIVDDGSDLDQSRIIVNRYISNKKNVSVIYFKKENGGASSARNLGIKHVSQPYVTFLDADDKMLPNNLNIRYNEIKNLNSSYFGVYGSGLTTEGKKQNFIDIDGVINTSYVGKYNEGVPGGCCYYMFRTHYLIEVGGFDEKLFNNEDFDLLIRLIKSGKACKGSIGRGNLITIRNNSLSRGSNPEKIFNNVMGFLYKAEINDYFEKYELNYRKKSAYLSLAKRIILKNPFKAKFFIRQAFFYSKPIGLKENLLYILCSVSISK